MSKYTTELRYICESLAGYTMSADYIDVEDVIEKARPKLFDFPYGIPMKNKKSFEDLFIWHYYRNEIGFETFGEFKRRLRMRLMELAPKYKSLYESVDFEYDPFLDVDYLEVTDGVSNLKKTGQIEVTQETTTESEGTDKNVNQYNDTPMDEIDFTTDQKFLTSFTIDDSSNQNKDETHASNSQSIDTNDKTTTNGNKRVTGKKGTKTYMELVQEYRDTIINVDLMLVEELHDLFMLIY